MTQRLAACLGLALALTTAPSRADMQTISGTLTVAPELAHHIGRNDRLIVKLYYPKDGVEMDATYGIIPSFSLPFAFQAAPSIDMNARTKYDAYVLELFTDKDDDVLAIAPGELIARTPAPVPLGTDDLQLELNAPRVSQTYAAGCAQMPETGAPLKHAPRFLAAELSMKPWAT